ncbi:protein sidekick-1 [Bombina bombina]|uniref:protein sidekick-1 n=1 Tax=Bombina bombina TaxID=8345 RepID=UPI00235A6392|nr:protein sidekick-1 [Bombina bombina]
MSSPVKPPQNVQVNPLTASQIDVTWDPPPASSQNGIIQGYKIYTWETNNRNHTETVLSKPENTVKLKNLTSYTSYSVSVSAFNAAGEGPKSDPIQGTTQQAAPSAPGFLAFTEMTSSTLNVTWGEPVTTNGILQGYRVVYEPLAPVLGVSKVVAVDIKGNKQRWLKVRDLTKGVTYNVQVQAKTVSFGPELQANITAGPPKGSPGSPQQVSISKSSSSLTLQWSEGSSGERPTTGFIIEARPSDEGLWDIFVRDIPRGATSCTISLDQLRPGVNYEFRVVAINAVGYGEPSLASAAVSAQTEVSFYEHWWFLLAIALTSIIFILLLVFALVLYGQNKRYQICSTGKDISPREDTCNKDRGTFAALELSRRHLNFIKKNGARSPPRPSPGGLHYSDEDICNKYNGTALKDNALLTDKPESEASINKSPSQSNELSDSDYEDNLPKHSFVNHYMTDPSYYNSWKRQQKNIKHSGLYGYEECEGSEPEPYFQTVTQSSGGIYTLTGQVPHGSRTPVTGFSSFV